MKENPGRADSVMELLRMNGGNSTESESDVSWDGTVHPDQFWRHHSLGNVREKPFSSIWSDEKSTVGIASKPQNTFKRTLRALRVERDLQW